VRTQIRREARWKLLPIYYGQDWQRTGPSHGAGRLPERDVATARILLGKSCHQTVLHDQSTKRGCDNRQDDLCITVNHFYLLL